MSNATMDSSYFIHMASSIPLTFEIAQKRLSDTGVVLNFEYEPTLLDKEKNIYVVQGWAGTLARYKAQGKGITFTAHNNDISSTRDNRRNTYHLWNIDQVELLRIISRNCEPQYNNGYEQSFKMSLLGLVSSIWKNVEEWGTPQEKRMAILANDLLTHLQ